MLFLFCRRLCRCRDADAGSNACARWHPYQCKCEYQYQHHIFLRNAQHNLFRIFKASTHNSFLAHCIKQITRLICFISFLFHLNAHIIHGSCLQLTFFYGFLLVCFFIIVFFCVAIHFVLLFAVYISILASFQFDWQIFIFHCTLPLTFSCTNQLLRFGKKHNIELLWVCNTIS